MVACGADGQCYVKNDGPTAFEGVCIVSFLPLGMNTQTKLGLDIQRKANRTCFFERAPSGWFKGKPEGNYSETVPRSRNTRLKIGHLHRATGIHYLPWVGTVERYDCDSCEWHIFRNLLEWGTFVHNFCNTREAPAKGSLIEKDQVHGSCLWVFPQLGQPQWHRTPRRMV